MTDQSNNGAGASGLEDTIVAKAPTRPTKRAAESAKTFTAQGKGADGVGAADANTEAGREAIKRLQAAVEQIEERAVELRQWADVRAEQARELIEEKPLTIVGAAFGVGLLLGLIASR